MTLRYSNYHRPLATPDSSWPASERAQIEAICAREGWEELLSEFTALEMEQRLALLEGEADDVSPELEEWEFSRCEAVDVVDAESGEPVLQVYFFDFGTAYAFKAGTTEDAGGAAQHSFELSPEFAHHLTALKDAHLAASPKVEQMMRF